MDDPPPLMVNYEPNRQQTKSHDRDDEEVHRRDSVLVIVQESDPALLLASIGCSLWVITRDGCETDFEAELLEFTVNLSSTPAILVRQSTNECLQLAGDRRSPGPRLRDGPPIEAEPLAVLANHCFRFDEDDGVFPARPEPESITQNARSRGESLGFDPV